MTTWRNPGAFYLYIFCRMRSAFEYSIGYASRFPSYISSPRATYGQGLTKFQKRRKLKQSLLKMVTPRRVAENTVAFIDHYCQHYYHLFEDVRHFEAFKFLHWGMLSEMPRKSLPAIAKTVGLKDSQTLHHFVREALWNVKAVRETRLWLTKLFIGKREIILCIDETGDKKKGKVTDYVARQYISNLGKTENGIVSVNAYGVVEGITYPLLFKIFKPRKCLKEGDKYHTKPQLAVKIIRELKKRGFKIKLVLADSMYCDSGDFIGVLEKLQMQFIVAIRSNHPMLMSVGSQKYDNCWQAYQQKISHCQSETRFIREIAFSQRRLLRCYQISKSSLSNQNGNENWYIMTNLPNNIQFIISHFYNIINWIEYGFKQVKNKLGWADFRLTDYASIERWWELVFSAYLLMTIQMTYFQFKSQNAQQYTEEYSSFMTSDNQDPNLEIGISWNSALKNLRLILKPYLLLSYSTFV
ncbi:hypothetical protein BZZ01_12155 [Nostocales cyanobacterium HT-58-2]|nr:hypothetical protein BZZ01_12155 [Nostocales cyanobacterium HT-58-2]